MMLCVCFGIFASGILEVEPLLRAPTGVYRVCFANYRHILWFYCYVSTSMKHCNVSARSGKVEFSPVQNHF